MNRNELLTTISKNIINIKKAGPILVGIDGIDGAGKTTLANELVPFIKNHRRKVIRASIDGFHNPKEKRIEKGQLSPVGYFEDSFDYDFLTQEFLGPIAMFSKTVKLPKAKFDWKTNSEVKDNLVEIDEKTIILFEGIFLFRPLLEMFWDYKIFIEIEFGTSLIRGLQRDSRLLGGNETTKEKYLKRYIPGQQLYIEKVNPKQKANLVIKNDDPTRPEIVSSLSLNI